MLSHIKNITLHSQASFLSAKSYMWALFTFAVFLAIPLDAQAAIADSLGRIICNVRGEGTAYPDFLSAVCYTMGVILILRGVLLLKKVSEAPGQTSPAIGIFHLLGGSILLALPEFTGFVQKTLLFGSIKVGGGGDGCNPGATGAAGAGGAVGLDIMAQNFVKNLYEPAFRTVSFLGYAVGATYIAMGLLRMVKTGTDPRASNPKDIILYLTIGAVLMSLSSVLPIMLSTIFGTDSISSMTNYSGIQWSKIVGSGADVKAANNTVQALLAFIQIVGIIAFFRGWLLVKRAVEGGQATIPQGMTHILGGAMAINMDMMLKIFDTTFGTGLIK